MESPTTEAIRDARKAAGLNQTEAAAVVYIKGAKRWSEYEMGLHAMHPAYFELFLLKTGQLVLTDTE